MVKDHQLLDRLRAAKYQKVAGNRFARQLTDIPVSIGGSEREREGYAFIDVLVPAYSSHARTNTHVGDELVTTEVLGLAAALIRPPLLLSLELHRLSRAVTRAGFVGWMLALGD